MPSYSTEVHRLHEQARLEQMRLNEQMRYAKPIDPTPGYLRDTSKATRDTKELLDALVQHAVDAEEREARMLWWTKAGVLLAFVAAVAALVTIVLTFTVD